jgi:hypothetical protein
VDSSRFDDIARRMGEQTGRRGLMKSAAGGALALLGLGVLGRAAVARNGKGFAGDRCEDNGDCEKGLRCDRGRERCEYKQSCGGRSGDACQKRADCCGNLRCRNERCRQR